MHQNSLINIKRKTNKDAGDGSFNEVYDIVEENVKASIQDSTLNDIIRAGRKINSEFFKCYISHNIELLGDDIIEYNNNDYEIVSKGTWINKYRKLFIEKII